MNSTIGGIADQAALVRLVEQCVAIDDPFDGVIFEIGFDGVDAGGLDASWRQQPGSAAYCTNLGASLLKDVMQGLTADDRAKLGERRDVALKKMLELPNGIVAKDSVPLLRSLAGLPD